ncbi:hypothetical protein AC622_13640 [Bacillus sp. FJAT-27916]|uniref:Cof-type HAD-IIB family hydrolase n=1 Tax=Bacillaceae TaxID=186817 RepID=UPI00067103D1|nr:Cof-type HAD-IIB family hydrolase [Bacillus sp. FJAT-27916]KMY45141.1 hypothetical protein AC622_13640 [Bacillus sp. FJAT-27916]
MGKICFFDIDGTLLDSEKKIPQSTKEALRLLKKNGTYIAIATGRAPFMIKGLLKELEIDSYVSFNGQYVVFEGEVIYRNPLSREQLTRLEMDSGQHGHSMVFMNDVTMKANVKHDPYIEESLGTLHFPHPELDPVYYKEQDIYQGLLFCEEHETALYEGKYPDIQFIRWHPYSMDVVPLGGSKAKGIEQVIKRKGFTMDDVYAFGDALNDMEMIQAAGCGVVMGNGVQQVKEHADFVTKSVDDDGIYYALKQLKLI